MQDAAKQFGGIKKMSIIFNAIQFAGRPNNYSGIKDDEECYNRKLQPYMLKPQLYEFFSSSSTSKSHATYFAPPLFNILGEVKSILDEDNKVGYIYMDWCQPFHNIEASNPEHLSQEAWDERKTYFYKKIFDVLKREDFLVEAPMKTIYGNFINE